MLASSSPRSEPNRGDAGVSATGWSWGGYCVEVDGSCSVPHGGQYAAVQVQGSRGVRGGGEDVLEDFGCGRLGGVGEDKGVRLRRGG